MTAERLRTLVETARQEGRYQLLEPEGFELLRVLGITVPRFEIVSSPGEISDDLLAALPGSRVVLKGIAADLLHKSEIGGVRIVPKSRSEVAAAAEEMVISTSGMDLRGLLLQELIDYELGPGSEAMLSMRWDREFGAVVTLGVGGIHADRITEAMREDDSLAFLAPELLEAGSIERQISGLLVTDLMTRPQRGRSSRVSVERLVELVSRFVAAAPLVVGELMDEVEINPLVARDGDLIALDILASRARPRPDPAPPRPLDKLDRLLRPASVALIGVARRLNPGRLILRNLLREGSGPADVSVIKPGLDTLEGCPCYPDIAALPAPVDLLIVSVSAEQAPEVLRQSIDLRKAETVILIPGGLEEKAGSKHLGEGIQRSLMETRKTEWRGPLVNGGNCLGIRSQPGRYDTFFLAEHKMAPIGDDEGNAALIAQSGAFLASKTSKLPGIRVRYAISVGNQIDLTLGDYLDFLMDDEDVDLFGVYAEGFKDLDGGRFLEAARRITSSGRRIVLYRAGRSHSGVEAAASHTAAMAGSYRMTRALARQAGVLVADTLEDFEDLLRLCSSFEGRSTGLMRVGAVSNAGYECVTIWDGVEPLRPASFSSDTQRALLEIFQASRIHGVVDVRNPLDLTPLVRDAEYAAAVRLVLEDPGVDVGVVGCVPFTAALNTLPQSSRHAEDVESRESLASRLARLWGETRKPWVAVVDAGTDYDRMANVLLEGGIPVFRTADRAVRLLGLYCGRPPAGKQDQG